MTVVAMLLAVAAASLACAPRRGIGWWGNDGPRHAVRGGPLLLVTPGIAAAVLLVSVDGRRLALALVCPGCLVAVAILARRARLATRAERRQLGVVEVCEALVGELRSGQPLLTSLEHCAEVWPDFEPAVSAARVGADVPAALRRLGQAPGAEDIVEIAAAWQVSERSGAGLASALSHVADTARERQATRQVVRGELASAQTTARLVAVLPLGSLAMSAGIGGDPWHFLLDTLPGVACLGLGAAFAFAGLLWIDRIASSVLRC